MHVKNVLASPRRRVGRIVTRSWIPLSFSRHWIDRNLPEINLGFRNRRFLRALNNAGAGDTLPALQLGWQSQRKNVDTFYQRVQIRRISIRIIDAEDCLVGNKNAHARIGEYIRWIWPPRVWFSSWNRSLVSLINLHLRAHQRFAMKLIDSFTHFAQGRPQLLFFLSFDGNLDEG